jgi:hypothetical protein
MRQSVVLDKSFLQASPTTYIRDLAESHRLLVSDALFYELLTTNNKVRAACFRKLPAVENPVDLLDHAGRLIRKELDTQHAAGKPSENVIPGRFEFNVGLRDPGFAFAPQVRGFIADQGRDIDAEMRSFVSRAGDIATFFSDLGLVGGSDEDRREAFEAAEARIASTGSLVQFIDSLESPPGERPIPPGRGMDESWAIYRWLQVQFLFGLDLFRRRGGKIPDMEKFGSEAFKQLEHDIHDAQVLVLGCLEGAVATDEVKLKRWFRLLCPDGLLLESPWKSKTPPAAVR